MATSEQTSNAFEGFAQPSTYASNKVACDVFINHRGPDSKDSLASAIYTALHGLGLQVFLDKEVLQLGDVIPFEIEEAMRTALLHIAILSPTYAHSTWCLDELSFMLKTGKKVIPVFYGVDPTDVRYIKGNFADEFDKHERKGRHRPEKLAEWKSALQRVSNIRGEILQGKDDEGRLLKSIVNSVMKEMNKKVQLEVAKHPVGLDEKIYDFERNVLGSSQKVQIVGIVGMGGLGKTTLAKDIYNRKISSIDKHSFLFDVRDAASKKVLHEKQKKLMQDIGVEVSSFDNVEDGKILLKRRMRSLKVFIILDDVDHPDQLDALLPDIDNFKQGSLIIVTSRELDILKKWGIASIYQMKGLNLEHARELFCWHAFLQSIPQNEYQDLVEKFVQICNGLPLSLKVFGGLLYRKSKEYWNSQLDKASRILPSDIKKSLEISFDALDEEEQEIFLDTACFLIGEEKSLAIAVWDGSGWSGVHSWEVLQNKCLVEVDEHNTIKMDDQLRDLGKEIAKGRSPFRVWSTQQIRDIHQKQTTERVLIRGIKAETDDFYEECSSLHATPFEECMELMRGCSTRFKALTPSILVVKENLFKENRFTEEIAALFPALLWLRWVECPHMALPSWLMLNNLRVLELPYAYYLQELWNDSADPPLELRQLDLTCAQLTSLPSSFGDLTNLQYLDLTSCQELIMLPESMGNFSSLTSLHITECFNLETLPESMGKLSSLTNLHISLSRRLETLPESMGKLSSLTSFYIESLNLKTLPESMSNLSSLTSLHISTCFELETLPEYMGNLSSLTSLHISWSIELKTLPESMGKLSSLTSLHISFCRRLETLPESMGNLSSLTSLNISWCDGLETLPKSMGNLSSLTSLHISFCRRLEALPESMGNLSSLTSLHIFKCIRLKTLPESLESLNKYNY